MVRYGTPNAHSIRHAIASSRRATQGLLCHWSVSKATSAAPNARAEVRHRHPNMPPHIMTPHTATIPADGERRTGVLATKR